MVRFRAVSGGWQGDQIQTDSHHQLCGQYRGCFLRAPWWEKRAGTGPAGLGTGVPRPKSWTKKHLILESCTIVNDLKVFLDAGLSRSRHARHRPRQNAEDPCSTLHFRVLIVVIRHSAGKSPLAAFGNEGIRWLRPWRQEMLKKLSASFTHWSSSSQVPSLDSQQKLDKDKFHQSLFGGCTGRWVVLLKMIVLEVCRIWIFEKKPSGD